MTFKTWRKDLERWALVNITPTGPTTTMQHTCEQCYRDVRIGSRFCAGCGMRTISKGWACLA